jgi:ubiquitin carboxyl-terminal hydrolase L5
LSILLNIKSDKIDIGSTLKDFKSFTESFNPEDRGTSLGSVDVIRNAHNSFSSQESFVFDEDKSSKGKVNLKSI